MRLCLNWSSSSILIFFQSTITRKSYIPCRPLMTSLSKSVWHDGSLPPVIPSGPLFHPDRQRYIFRGRRQEMHGCNFGVDVEGWSGERIGRVICMDPLLSKRICSTSQWSGEDLVMWSAILVTSIAKYFCTIDTAKWTVDVKGRYHRKQAWLNKFNISHIDLYEDVREDS